MATIENEPRVDGQNLAPLRERGSDELLSPEVRERIAQVVRDWVPGKTRGMSEQTQDPAAPVDPANPPEQGDDREREREDKRENEREDDGGAGDGGGAKDADTV